MRYLVDSDWVADYLKGRAPAVELLDSLIGEGMAISIITYAEILEGTYFGRDPARSGAVFRRFLEGVAVRRVTSRIAERFARISGELRGQGLLIPSPDLFVGTTAVQRRLILVTRNRRHFERIPGIQLL